MDYFGNGQSAGWHKGSTVVLRQVVDCSGSSLFGERYVLCIHRGGHQYEHI
jgi:hypothetical protein